MPTSTTELYKVTYSSTAKITVSQYIDDPSSPAICYTNNHDDFLKVRGPDGLTNRQRIEASFKTPEQKKHIGADAKNLPVPVGVALYLDFSKVNNQDILTQGIGVVSTDAVAFMASKLAELQGDAGYVSVVKPIQGQVQQGSLKNYYPDCSVWMWCQALSPKSDQDSDLTGDLFDLTPFIQSLSTNMGKTGGNFQITLPALACELDSEKRWVIKRNTLIQYDSSIPLGKEYVSEASLFDIESGNGELVANKFLFNQMISPNDLVFIRFETLKMEAAQRYSDAKQYLINKANLANRIYDMIGLCDRVGQSINPASNDVSITIEGRDLSKLFIEDGTYFYALENSQGMLKFAGQSTQKNTQISRIFGDGALNFLALYMFSPIETIFKFILQQLANIEIVPDALLSSYKYSKRTVNGVTETYDGRNDRYNITERLYNKRTDKGVRLNETGYIKQYVPEKAPGIWQIIKLVIDSSVADRRLADTSLSTAQGSLLNFFKSAAQEPLVEFYMDTYGDQYHMIIRKPPYDQKALLSLIEGRPSTEDGTPATPPAIIDIEADDVLAEKLFMDDSEVYSWYSFFPANALIGDSKNFSLAYLGALYFEEYAQVFGAKAFQRSHPYLSFTDKNRTGSQQLDIFEQQAISDLKYVVETNQYTPFTRKGTITLNGDRRLKIGNIIRYKPTGEIFFIDHVQQNYQINENAIDRTTTIMVSRGMVEQLIYGIKVQNAEGAAKYVSYFNIIDTRLDLSEKEIKTDVVVRKKTGTRQIQKQNFSLFHPIDAITNLVADILPQTTTLKTPSMVTGKAYLETYNAYPQNKNIFINFINGITDKGYKVIILPLAANRTFAQQAALKHANGNNAVAGASHHEVGRAIDITVINKYDAPYSKNTPEASWRDTGIPELANLMGLQWGGPANNGTFGSYVDRVHFELIGTLGTVTVTEDVHENVTEHKNITTIDRDGIFSHFKVNKFTFNWFRKHLQFDPEYRTVTSRAVYQSDQAGSLPDYTDQIIQRKLKNIGKKI